MSESVVIQCPKCQKKLRLQRSQLGKQFRCPGCKATLSTPGPAVSNSPKPSKSVRKKSSDPAHRPTSAKRKKKPKPQQVVDDPWMDDAVDDGQDDDLYADDFGDDYGDDLFADDEYGDDAYGADPYGDSAGMPSPRRKKKKKKTSGKSELRPGEIRDLNTGPLGWILAALIGGFAGIVLTTLVGFTGIEILVYIMAIITGSLVGGAVRYAAGVSEGWGPGIVAGVIAFAAILGGRVSAFYVFPGMAAAFEGDEMSPAEIDRFIEQQASADGQIAAIAENNVEYNEAWMSREGVSEDDIDDHWEAHEGDDDIRARFLPAVWEEATRLWNLLPDQEKEARKWNSRVNTMQEWNRLDEETLTSHIAYLQSDFEMVKSLAGKLRVDVAWTRQAGIPTGANTLTWEQTADSFGIHPRVWQEAQIRWTDMAEGEKAAEREQVETVTRANYETNEELKEAVEPGIGNLRIIVALAAAVISLLLPIWAFFFCTCAGIGGAFKIGAGLVTD